jgi:peptidoglycan/LPS O-acetylase OafA/YrhL
LYLCHAVPGWIVGYIVYDLWGQSWGQWIVAATFIALTPFFFLIAWILNRWIETPLRRLGQKRNSLEPPRI